MSEVFPCSACGLCCQHVNAAEQTQFLDRGDGTCRHYVVATRKCGIYEDRPDICRVDLQFSRHYAATMSWDAFVDVNLQACRFLQAAAAAGPDADGSHHLDHLP